MTDTTERLKSKHGTGVTVIIPSRKETFLDKTINDVLTNSRGTIEIIVVLDGYDKEDKVERIKDPRVKYICLPDNGECQKRQGINAAVSISNGEFIMCLDAHCMVGPGFDTIMSRDCTDKMVMIPRRYKLEPETWTTRKDVKPIDYEYWMKQEWDKGLLKPYRWDRPERADIMVDDTLTMQASCWFMKKTWFLEMGFMRLEGYTGWGQEDVEICLETWLHGGRCVVNKGTYTAHLFKGKQYGRMYYMPRSQYNISREWAFNYWCIERREDFFKVLNMFPDLPKWNLKL